MQLKTFKVSFRLFQPHTGESWTETYEVEATDSYAARDMAEYDAECDAERDQAEARFECSWIAA